MEQLFVIIGAILLIGGILWWFFGKRTTHETEASVSGNKTQEVTVTVSGGYTPNTVVFKQGVPAKIVFDRKDPSGCFNEVIFPDFGVHEVLPVGEQHSVDIATGTAGEYQYTCGMNMFHGKVIIK